MEYNAYHMAQLHAETLVYFIQLLKKKILSYHMLNLVKKKEKKITAVNIFDDLSMCAYILSLIVE